MSEQLPSQPQHTPEHSRNTEQTTTLDQLLEEDTSTPEQSTEHRSEEAPLVLGGLQKAIAKYRLRRTQNQLDSIEETGQMSPRQVRKNDAKQAKIGRRGAVNIGLEMTYGPKPFNDPRTKGNLRARLIHDRNETVISKKRGKVVDPETYREKLELKKAELEETIRNTNTRSRFSKSHKGNRKRNNPDQ